VQVGRRDAEAAVSRITGLLKERRLYDGSTLILIGARGRSAVTLDAASFRIPLLIKQPDREGAGHHVVAPVRQVDLLPTILDFVRAPLPGGLDGRSLRAAIDNGTHLEPQPVYAESLAAYYRFGGPAIYALWTDKARVTRSGAENPPAQDADTAALQGRLDRIIEQHPPDAAAPIAAADEDSLALNGYLQGLPAGAARDDAAPAGDIVAMLEAHRAAARAAGQRQYGTALRLLEDMAHEHPTAAALQYQIGNLLLRSGRNDEAATAFRTAMALRPDRPEIPMALARALMRAGHLDEAQHQADAAVTLASQAPASLAARAHETAARVALARADADAATDHAEAARAADPMLPLPQFVRGRLLYDKAQYEEALAAFREAETAIQQNGGSLEQLHLYLGQSLARLEQAPQAEEEFREEVQEFPHDLQAYSALAMLYRASDRDGDVEDVLNELVDAAPTPEGYAMAARLWSTLGDRGRAEALRSDARTRFRGDPSLVLLGRGGRR
jgi:Flp pilus assembly protein TadD